MAYANGQPIPNQYAVAPEPAPVTQAELDEQQRLHAEAGDWISKIIQLQNDALSYLDAALALLSVARTMKLDEDGLNSYTAFHEVKRMHDQLEDLNFDNLADEVRPCRR